MTRHDPTVDDILDGYASAATPDLIERYESFDLALLFASVIDLFPQTPQRIADIGAGTGRDAAWFASQGHTVFAVEPVRAFREAGKALHPNQSITWIDDRLPHLDRLRAFAPFHLVTLSGVWQHIDDEARAIAMALFGAIVEDRGRLVLSLRHGPGAPGRPVFAVDTAMTIGLAAAAGFRLLRQRGVESIQPGNRAMGVSWHWLAFEKGVEGDRTV